MDPKGLQYSEALLPSITIPDPTPDGDYLSDLNISSLEYFQSTENLSFFLT